MNHTKKKKKRQVKTATSNSQVKLTQKLYTKVECNKQGILHSFSLNNPIAKTLASQITSVKIIEESKHDMLNLYIKAWCVSPHFLRHDSYSDIHFFQESA